MRKTLLKHVILFTGMRHKDKVTAACRENSLFYQSQQKRVRQIEVCACQKACISLVRVFLHYCYGYRPIGFYSIINYEGRKSTSLDKHKQRIS